MNNDQPGADERLRRANVPGPVGPATERAAISLCREVNGYLILAGQVAQRDGALVAEGRVGSEVDLATARSCARQCAVNLLEAARLHLGSLDRVRSVLRLAVYVASAPDFVSQHLVADAASTLVAEVVGGDLPVRVAIGVACLPLGSPVEVEAILELAGEEVPSPPPARA
jgi:enamine deaminase RidA (YjgF/YER057c/UK114 family)